MQMVRGAQEADAAFGRGMTVFIGISSMAAFVMTITIIVLIMQGNQRSFYHEQVSGMQAGMISFMADVVENRDDHTGGRIRRTATHVEGIAKALKKQGAYSDVLTDRYARHVAVAEAFFAAAEETGQIREAASDD